MSEQDLTDHINKTFETKFTKSQIKYQLGKIFEASYGKPDADAESFVKLAEKDCSENGGHFYIELTQQRNSSELFICPLQ